MLLCDEVDCGAVQHAACSMQSNSEVQHWHCDDCWLMAGEQPEEGSRRIEAGSDGQGSYQAEEVTAKQRQLSMVHRLSWVTGAKVLDASGVEHTIQAMQHGYVQCSRLGEAGCCNYHCKELQLLLSVSDSEESHSSASEKDDEDPLSDDASDWEDSLEDAGMAAEGPGQDSSGEL